MNYPRDPTACAQQLLTEHAAKAGFKGTAQEAEVGAPEVQKGLADILKMLFATGLNFDKIITFAQKIIPLVIAKNWWGIIAAVVELFSGVPTPAPTPTPVGPFIQGG